MIGDGLPGMSPAIRTTGPLHFRMLGIPSSSRYHPWLVRNDSARVTVACMIATQHSLVARMRSGGSEEDWRKFYHLYERPILAFAASHSLNSVECADVLQETMVKMLRVGFFRFNPGKGRFTGFLFNIARCCVIDAIRRRARSERRHVSLDAADHSAFGAENSRDNLPGPAEAAERQGEMELISITLNFLLERKRFQQKTIEIFKAVALEQKDAKEVAHNFHTSTGNVYEVKRAVLAKLRSMLRELDKGLDLEQALSAE
jgi:RNA polymerase sigma factor (sigma-70 family)